MLCKPLPLLQKNMYKPQFLLFPHTTSFSLLSATCSVHWAKQTAVQHKHTLSFHREASDKNHPTIHGHKDTFNKGSDSIYPLISSAFYIFGVIKSLLHWWWEVIYRSQTDCWDKLISSSKFGTFIRAVIGPVKFRGCFLIKVNWTFCLMSIPEWDEYGDINTCSDTNSVIYRHIHTYIHRESTKCAQPW